MEQKQTNREIIELKYLKDIVTDSYIESKNENSFSVFKSHSNNIVLIYADINKSLLC